MYNFNSKEIILKRWQSEYLMYQRHAINNLESNII